MSLENAEDRLSTMPEEIVSHILSLMPTKFAVQTCTLSKRWKRAWMFVTNLIFEDYEKMEINSLTKLVDRGFKFPKTSQLNLFRLQFPLNCFQSLNESNWIIEAMRLHVRELDIHVRQLRLPLSMFTCKTLTILRLHIEWSNWECPCSVNLPSLKTLDIVVFTNPFVDAFKLICGCPMLESLSLDVSWHKEEKDYVFNIPTLKRLKLKVENALFNKVVLHVPKLEYLFVGGMLCSLFVMKDLPPLIEASVSLNFISLDHLLVELLKGLSGVKSLSILSIPINSHLSIFTNMKHLEYLEFKCSLHFGTIPQFLESCSQLKHLCIEMLEESSWIKPKLVPACMLTNLTTIKFSKCKGEKYDIEFLEYMLGKAEVLKTVTITWENLCIEEQTLLAAQVLSFPRASRCCEVHFHGNCSHSISRQ